MASIILSFVGQQDPFSGNTNTEGSIVSLVRHLVAQGQKIKHIILLATAGTEAGGKDTQEWLQTELGISQDAIELILVDEALSQDPIDVSLATNTAKQAIERARIIKDPQDTLELNGSSGTPAMKSTWSILQAAGYAPNSHVWQVRNPKELKAEQSRIFYSDVSGLKREFELTIIKQQLAEYNYSGALAVIDRSQFSNPIVNALLTYGNCRLSFDFDRANQSIQNFRNDIAKEFYSEIGNLRQKKKESLVTEIYFIALISRQNKHYCDFLIAVAQFQENILSLLMSDLGLDYPESNQVDKFWKNFKKNHVQIFESIDTSKRKSISTQGFPNRPTMMEIIKLFGKHNSLLENLESLGDYCEKRNGYIHKLQGTSQIDDADFALNNINNILKQVTKISNTNPYDRLNKTILDLLGQ